MGSMKEVLGKVWKPIVLIWIISVLRSFVSQTFGTFLPVLCAREGFSLFFIGAIVSLYSIAGAISGLIAGHLSDRIGYKPIFYVSSLLATVFLYLLIVLPGRWILVNAFLSGFFIMAILPAHRHDGPGTRPQGQIDRFEPHDGIGFRDGRHDDSDCGVLCRPFLYPVGAISRCLIPCVDASADLPSSRDKEDR